MKILLTGATGFIGSHIAEQLVARGHEVLAVSRSPGKAVHCNWHSRVDWLELDLEQEHKGLFERSGRPDLLIHAAWEKLDRYRDVDHFEHLPTAHYRFISTLIREGLSQCLVTGTCLEYGMQNGALHEELPCRPILAYPLGKHLLRQMLVGLQQQHPFRLQWARLFYLHGKGQKPNSLLSQLDRAISEGRKIFDMSPGDQLRDYLPVDEAARLLCSIAEQRDFDGVVNCCSGTAISVRSLVESHLQMRGASLTLNTGKHAYPDYEPFSFWGDRAKLDRLLISRNGKAS